jgi:hypothetical protein
MMAVYTFFAPIIKYNQTTVLRSEEFLSYFAAAQPEMSSHIEASFSMVSKAMLGYTPASFLIG